jgi:hypothetical protein
VSKKHIFTLAFLAFNALLSGTTKILLLSCLYLPTAPAVSQHRQKASSFPLSLSLSSLCFAGTGFACVTQQADEEWNQLQQQQKPYPLYSCSSST